MCKTLVKLLEKIWRKPVQAGSTAHVAILPSYIGAEHFFDACEFFEIIQKNEGCISKWVKPVVSVAVSGSFDMVDYAFICKMLDAFSSVSVLRFVLVAGDADINIHYVKSSAEYAAFRALYGFSYAEWANHCYTYYRYGEIYKAVICLLDNRSEKLQESVTLHEFFHALGFPHVASQNNKKYSIVGSDLAKNPCGLSSADLLAFNMLYNPQISAGCTFETLRGYYIEHGLL